MTDYVKGGKICLSLIFCWWSFTFYCHLCLATATLIMLNIWIVKGPRKIQHILKEIWCRKKCSWDIFTKNMISIKMDPGFFLHHKFDILTWSWFSTKFDIVTMISSWFLHDFKVICPWFFRDLWSESLSWRDREVIFHQFSTYNRYFLVITTCRDEKPW